MDGNIFGVQNTLGIHLQISRKSNSDNCTSTRAILCSPHRTHTTSLCPISTTGAWLLLPFYSTKHFLICSPLGCSKVKAAYQVLAEVLWWPCLLCLPLASKALSRMSSLPERERAGQYADFLPLEQEVSLFLPSFPSFTLEPKEISDT